MVGLNNFPILASSVLVLLILLLCNQDSQALASAHYKRHKTAQSISPESSNAGRHSRGKRHSSSARSTRHKNKVSKSTTAKARYAYPMGTFLMEPPTFEATPLPEEISTQIKKAFYSGNAGEYPTRSLVRAGIASYYPMRGGIFWRREPIKYLIMHSTEPGIPVGARTIVDGWSHGGRRHAGAHYVIDRDGTIYQAVDPDLATVHLNIFKTLPGINNDNSVGIEMCHCGSQDYPPALVESASRLAAYLQSHYHIAEANIITHRYAQQGDHTDPVNFAWDNFIAQKDTLQNQGLNQRLALLKTQIFNWQPIIEQPTIIVEDKKSKSNKVSPVKQEPPKVIEVLAKPAPKPEVPKLIEVQAKPVTAPEMPIIIQAQTKPVVKAEPTKVVETQVKPAAKPEQKVQSAFEAKFGPVDKFGLDSQAEEKLDSASIETPTSVNSTTTLPIKSPPPTHTILSAPIPSSGSTVSTNITVPMDSPNNTSNNANRLVPTPQVNRLVPVTMIINTQPNNNSISRPASKSISDPTYPNTLNNTQINQSTEKRSSRMLPLRGPIEMEPDEASLLSQ